MIVDARATYHPPHLVSQDRHSNAPSRVPGINDPHSSGQSVYTGGPASASGELLARAYPPLQTHLNPSPRAGPASTCTLRRHRRRRHCCAPYHFRQTPTLYTSLFILTITSTTRAALRRYPTALHLRIRLPGEGSRGSACGLPRPPAQVDTNVAPSHPFGGARGRFAAQAAPMRCARRGSNWTIRACPRPGLESVAFRRAAITRVVPQSGVHGAPHGAARVSPPLRRFCVAPPPRPRAGRHISRRETARF